VVTGWLVLPAIVTNTFDKIFISFQFRFLPIVLTTASPTIASKASIQHAQFGLDLGAEFLELKRQ